MYCTFSIGASTLVTLRNRESNSRKLKIVAARPVPSCVHNTTHENLPIYYHPVVALLEVYVCHVVKKAECCTRTVNDSCPASRYPCTVHRDTANLLYCTYQVVLNARSEDKLKVAADEIKASGGDVAIAVGDVSKVNKGSVKDHQFLRRRGEEYGAGAGVGNRRSFVIFKCNYYSPAFSPRTLAMYSKQPITPTEDRLLYRG